MMIRDDNVSDQVGLYELDPYPIFELGFFKSDSNSNCIYLICVGLVCLISGRIESGSDYFST